MVKPGYFVFSLDTELASGYFDLDRERHRLFSNDGVRERERIDRILSLCNQYQIHATWAVVGHLFYETCEFCDYCPIRNWKGKFSSYEEAYATSNPLWYGADVIRKIQGCLTHQEIGFHGYTHSIFNSPDMTFEKAEIGITEWKRLASRFGIEGKSVVFPRNQAAYHEAFKNAGFKNFRADDQLPLIIRNRYFGRYVQILDHVFGISTAPVYTFHRKEVGGLIQLDSSGHLFAFDRNVDHFLDRLGLNILRIRRLLRGIEKAARSGSIFHLWAHPWSFETEDDFVKLEKVFQNVHLYVTQQRLQSVTMSEIGDMISLGSTVVI